MFQCVKQYAWCYHQGSRLTLKQCKRNLLLSNYSQYIEVCIFQIPKAYGKRQKDCTSADLLTNHAKWRRVIKVQGPSINDVNSFWEWSKGHLMSKQNC